MDLFRCFHPRSDFRIFILVVFILLLLLSSVAKAFLRVTVSHSDALNVFSSVVGWIYFAAWSVSFYPQVRFYHVITSSSGLFLKRFPRPSCVTLLKGRNTVMLQHRCGQLFWSAGHIGILFVSREPNSCQICYSKLKLEPSRAGVAPPALAVKQQLLRLGKGSLKGLSL